MVVKISLLMLSVLIGAWMLFDGLHVIRKGKYFGPDELGQWSNIIASLGVNPYSIGPVFVGLGLAWFVSVAGLLVSSPWGWVALLLSAIATLWYLKIGTIISVIVIVLLIIFKASLGYV